MENEQINVIMEKEGLTPAQFASAIGIQRAQVSHLQNNRNHVSLDVVKRIHAAFPSISAEWLLTGNGSYYIEGSGPSPSSQESMSFQGGNMLFDDLEPDSEAVDATPQPSENRKISSEDRASSFFCKENVSEQPLNDMQNADVQCVEHEKQCHRNILEIKVFYDDGTYETFVRQ